MKLLKQALTHIRLFYLAGIFLALPVFAQDNDSSKKTIKINNPLGDVNSVPELVNNIVTVVLGVVGAIALAMFIYGGVMWLTSAGNQQRIEKGRETLVWATIGLMIIFGSYAILRAIFAALG